ncbi:MAG: polysaccharide pyruvyl transferase family protein [Pyrobaculum sp.]|jgi:polysaccharide pyruvyl transferase WcaK-like protein
MVMKILVASVVAPNGLGDELQNIVGAVLITKHFSNAKVDMFVPTGSLNAPLTLIPSSSSIRILQGFHERTDVFSIFRMFVGSGVTKQKPQKVAFPEYNTTLSKNLVSKLKDLVYKRYYENTIMATYVRPPVGRFIDGLKYDGGFIAGHTLEYAAFFDDLLTYNCARFVVKGPLIIYPISASLIGLKHRERYLKALRKALQRFDVIFVRGRYSYDILTKFVDPSRLFVTLDSGFGIRILAENPGNFVRRRSLVVCIVPRSDYFYFYNLGQLYPRYLLALKHLIRVLISEFDAEIWLVPHTVKSSTRLGDEYAIHDLLGILDESLRRNIEIKAPQNIFDSARIFNSCDMVITSRMHAGIVSLAYGKPTLFFMPRDDVKVLDVLSYLGLSEERYIVDSFDPREYDKLPGIVKDILFNLSRETKTIEFTIGRHLPDIEKPVILAKKLLSDVRVYG